MGSVRTVFWEDDTGEIHGTAGRPGETSSGLGRLRGGAPHSCTRHWRLAEVKQLHDNLNTKSIGQESNIFTYMSQAFPDKTDIADSKGARKGQSYSASTR